MGHIIKNKVRMRLGMLTAVEGGVEFTDLVFDTEALSERIGLAVMKQHVRELVSTEVFDMYESRIHGKTNSINDMEVELSEWGLNGSGYDIVATLWYMDEDNGYTKLAKPLMYRVEVEKM